MAEHAHRRFQEKLSTATKTKGWRNVRRWRGGQHYPRRYQKRQETASSLRPCPGHAKGKTRQHRDDVVPGTSARRRARRLLKILEAEQAQALPSFAELLRLRKLRGAHDLARRDNLSRGRAAAGSHPRRKGVPRRRRLPTCAGGQGGVARCSRSVTCASVVALTCTSPRGSAGAGRPNRAATPRGATGAPCFWYGRPRACLRW